MRKPISAGVRFRVFKRDGFSCQYCGATPPEAQLEADHIRPVARGGSDALANLITACRRCNAGKAATEAPMCRAVELTIAAQRICDRAMLRFGMAVATDAFSLVRAGLAVRVCQFTTIRDAEDHEMKILSLDELSPEDWLLGFREMLKGYDHWMEMVAQNNEWAF